MEAVFSVISEKPEYFAWAFGLVNALWAGFLYFNSKRHEKELIGVQQSFDLDLERRKKLFEMKAGQYESYFRHLDLMHQKHQTDYEDVFLPIMNEFVSAYLQAADKSDEEAATQATIHFSEKVSKITRDGMKELGVIESETNSLRLTATDEIANLLDEIKGLYDQMFALSGKMMNDLVQIAIKGDQELANRNQAELAAVGEKAQRKAVELREQMRRDLQTI
jgi:hypothetical protein